MLGIRQASRNLVDQAVTSSIVLVDATLLAITLAANAIAHLRFVASFSTGATGGCRFQVVTPAAVTSFMQSVRLFNTGAGTIIPSVLVASTAVANALANAGNHQIEIDIDIVNGANAGDVKLQFAQNTSDVLTITLLKGSFVEATILG